jgi:hypothetical protein
MPIEVDKSRRAEEDDTGLKGLITRHIWIKVSNSYHHTNRENPTNGKAHSDHHKKWEHTKNKMKKRKKTDFNIYT